MKKILAVLAVLMLMTVAFAATASADQLDTIKERFKARMHGNLPEPVARMLERKHGMFDSGEYDFRFDSTKDDAAELCARLMG